MALLITAFSLFVRLGFAMFVVDFAHKLHFQVRLVKDECHAIAHHNLVIQASVTNNTKSTTELSPVLMWKMILLSNFSGTQGVPIPSHLTNDDAASHVLTNFPQIAL